MKTKRYHYIFDAEQLSEEVVTKKEVTEKILHELPSRLNMSILSGPYVVDGLLINPGVSGFCIIDFSHISIHTFAEPKEACVDIFSCKPFDVEGVKKYLLETFQVAEEHVTYKEVQYG